MKAAFFNNGRRHENVYGRGRLQRIAELTDLYPHVVSQEAFAEHVSRLSDLQVIFSTWGMPQLDAEQIDLECSLAE